MGRTKKSDSVAMTEQQPDDEIDHGSLDLAADTLTGDLRDFILDRLRHEQDKRPWNNRSEAEQRITVSAVEEAVRSRVTTAIEIIAAGGRRTIKATLSQATVKDGIKATLELSKADELRHLLFDSVGRAVLIVVADPDQFTGERAPAAINPDQGDLVADAAVVHADTENLPFH